MFPKDDQGEQDEEVDTAQWDWNSAEALAAESAMAAVHGVGWRDRGPPGPKDGGPQTWRGGTYRPNAKRWAKRSGRHLDYYNSVYGRKGQKKSKGKGQSSASKGKGQSSASEGKGQSSA